MSLVNDEQLLGALFRFNPWWQTGILPADFEKPMRRFAFFEAWRVMTHAHIRRTVLLSGPRRVGKTTILYQMIGELLRAGVRSTAILYVSLDHPLFKLCDLGRIVEIYRRSMASEEAPLHFFLDEVQYGEDWDHWVKILHDQNPGFRIVATGSASPLLAAKASESGVGRWTTVRVPTLSFYEYLVLTGAERPAVEGDPRPLALVGRTSEELVRLVHLLSALQRPFNRYLLVGGFPEIALADDVAYGQRLMREDIVDKVLKRDLTALFGVRNVADLERLFLYLCLHSGEILSPETVAGAIGVSRPTVLSYLTLLETASLIHLSAPAELGGKKVLRSRPKVYLADAAIRNAVLLMGEEVLADSRELGLLVETTVFKHVVQFYGAALPRIGYYRDGRTGREIDVVVALPAGNVLIEVKYRESPALGPQDALADRAGASETLAAFVVTKRPEDTGFLPPAGERKILQMPAFALLYLFGYAQNEELKGVRQAAHPTESSGL